MFGGRVVWANSIFGPSYNYEAPEITFGDGHKISPELLAEMRATTERLTRNIDWRNGDVLLIDNTRVMHGRREIKDTSRTIFNALSYLSDSLRPATSGTPNAFAVNHLG
jgi:alpha-ketoglutarate-dependent taurine dioxygenase